MQARGRLVQARQQQHDGRSFIPDFDSKEMFSFPIASVAKPVSRVAVAGCAGTRPAAAAAAAAEGPAAADGGTGGAFRRRR